MRNPRIWIAVALVALLAALPGFAQSTTIVISQVYGGAGCGTTGCSAYNNDYIEVFNRSSSPVSVNGWAVQYASATGSSWQVTALPNASIPAGGYLLVQEGGNTNGLLPLPTPDVVGTINMSASAGKIALTNTTTALSGTCPSGGALIDLIGYGTTANCSEGGSNAPAPGSNFNALFRASNGCTDTDVNGSDFSAAAAAPRNSASPGNPCTPVTPALSVGNVSQNEGDSGTSTFAFTVSLSSPALAGGVSFDIATADGTATVADSDYVANSVTGATIAAGASSYTFNVTVNGDTNVEPDEVFFVNVTNVSGATVTSNQGVGTIVNDDFLIPALSIDDVSQPEGNSGTSTFTFTVSLSFAAPAGGVSFDIATDDDSATVAENDYVANSVTGATIAEGSTSYTFDVTVNGDTDLEPDETFFINVTSVSGATVNDGQGLGTIVNDDLPPALLINEILADPANGLNGDANGDGVGNSSDDEFVEIVNNTGADVDISGWTLSDAVGVRHTFPADTIVTDNCAVVVFGGGTPTGAFGGAVVQTASTGALGLSNGGDTVTLRFGAVTSATYTYGSEGGNDQSLTRSPDFTGSFVQHTTAPGAGGARFSAGKLLTGYPFSGCFIEPTFAEIFEIQDAGLVSPYAGHYVTTENNVVTALAADGFFIQTPDTRDDNDPDTSNGIFVYTTGAPTVLVGDVVNVTGEVKEYFEFTEITFPTVTEVGTGAEMPTAIVFDAGRPDGDPGNPPAPSCAIEYECWEGMRISIANGMVSGPNQQFGTDPFAEMYAVASPNRPFREPGIEFPGLPGLPVWDGNPEVFELDPDRLGLANAVMPPGTTFSATGVLGYEFWGWELWPTELTFDTPPVLPRAVRERNPFEMTVGSLNLLDYNSSTTDFAVRTAKHSGYIRTVLGAPDVLGVSEVENLVTLEALAAQILLEDPTVSYTAHLGPVDKSGIDVGFLVRDTVTNVAITQLGADEIFPLTGALLHDRPPLLVEGDYIGNGAPFGFAVMVNHTRSLIDIDAPDPEGNRVRQKRLAQAQSIAQMVQAFQTTNPTTPLVLVGDYNAFEFSDSYVDVIGQIAGDAVEADNLVWAANITNPVLTKQTLSVPAADRYSFVYQGSSQVLDHALTTQATDTWVRGMAFGRGNSDAAVQFFYDDTTILRGSDHDGLVVYLVTDGNGNDIPDDLDAADLQIAKSGSPNPVLLGEQLTYTLQVTNLGPAPTFGVTVTDALPAGVVFGTATGTGWNCNHTAGTVTCTVATLSVGPAPDITIVVTAPSVPGVLSNTAAIASQISDPVTTNNLAAAQTTVEEEAVPPLLMIDSVSQNEGNSGSTTFTFTVTLSDPAPAGGVSLDIATADGTATVADNDYVANSATGATIAEGGTSYTFNVTVNGDTDVEPDEVFYVNVTNVTGAVVEVGQGVGTILNDDILVPALSINNVSQAEGDSGTSTFTFTVTLSDPAPAGGVSFDIATADGTATVADNDYVANSATGATIAEGGTSYTFNVTINGDTVVEPDEVFYVNVTNVTGANVTTSQGVGTILNDDILVPALSINNVSQAEGDSGTSTFAFTVTLSDPAPAGGVSFDIATADGTAAVADNDYVANSATGATIAEGGTSYTFNVTVNGDTDVEPDEVFYVNVTNVTGATVTTGQGVGTILNDDVEVTTFVVTVSANPTTGGSVSGGGTFNEGDIVTVSATPNAGWEFVHWLIGTDQITANPYAFTVTEDVELTAVFRRQAVEPIPLAGPWGLLMLFGLLAGLGAWLLRRM